jgi:histidine phosphotransferase ChpT
MRPANVDLSVLELLCSKLCHDLVGPVGAVNNGMELLEDEDAQDMAREAVALAGRSAQQAATVLQFYRLAYGAAGGRSVEFSDARKHADALLAHSKIDVDWPALLPDGGLPLGVTKLLLNMLALAEEALARGGRIEVVMREAEDALEVETSARGTEARLREETLQALAPDFDVDELTPRSVQAYFTALVARRLGGELVLGLNTPDQVKLSVRLANSASAG